MAAGRCPALLFPSWHNCVPFLDVLEGALVLGDLEQPHGTPFLLDEAAHLSDRMNFVCLVRCRWRALTFHILGHGVALLRPTATG